MLKQQLSFSRSLSLSQDPELQDINGLQITPTFFDRLLSFKQFQDLLTDLDVSDEDQIDLFDTLDVDGSGAIDIEELVIGICKLRGDARRSDIVGVALIVRNISMELTKFEAALADLQDNQEEILKNLGTRADMRKSSRRTQQSGR